MTRPLRALGLGLALALSLWVMTAVRTGSAADDEKEVKAAREAVLKIADDIKDGEEDKTQAYVKKLKIEPGEVKLYMKSMALRREGGVGLGTKAGQITPDGIEAKIINLSKKAMAPATLSKDADALVRMANIAEACATIAIAFPPKKKVGKKDPKDWMTWSKDMKESARELAKAVKAQKPDDVKDAINRLYESCTNCHGPFKPS
jgi:cytochrome c556